MASNTDRARNLAPYPWHFPLAIPTVGFGSVIRCKAPGRGRIRKGMTEKDESSEIAGEGAAKEGEAAGRSTRMFSVCPNCGARHNTVNDTKGVWICPDCGKPYDPY